MEAKSAQDINPIMRDAAAKLSKQVYFFGTCLVDIYDPEAGLAAIELLERCGMEVVYPQEQTCCGQASYNSGYSDEARAIAKKHVDLFDCGPEVIPLIVPSASCAGMFKHHYPALFENDPKYYERATKLAERTYELIDFLSLNIDLAPLNNNPAIKIALHASCASQREIKVAHSWHKLLKRCDHITVIEPANSEECCGFGGTFAVKCDSMSAKMTEDKANALTETGADIIVSGDPGCLLSLGSHFNFLKRTGKNEKQIPIMHLASFLNSQFITAEANG